MVEKSEIEVGRNIDDEITIQSSSQTINSIEYVVKDQNY
jgi:hypothetical protein